MKKGKRRLTIVFICIVAGIVGVFVVMQVSTVAQNDQIPLQTAIDRTRPDLRPDVRRIVERDEPEWRQNVALNALVSESKLIAVGVPIRNACRRSHDGNQVTTDYEISLQEVIKGDVQPGSVIGVSMPGGLITEAGGALLEVRTRQIRKMRNGKTYVLFLKNAPGGSSAFAPLRGSQGLYEIPQEGSRVVHLGRSFQLPPADDGEEIAPFLQNIRDLVRNR